MDLATDAAVDAAVDTAVDASMEVCQRGESWAGDWPDLVYDHTTLIFEDKKGDFFYAITKRRGLLSGPVDIDALVIQSVSQEIWPPFPPSLTRAPQPLSTNCYLKRPCLLYCTNDKNRDIGNLLIGEAVVCEVLKRNPHPNIAQYLGCLEVDKKFKGICFLKYSMTLDERTKVKKPLDVDMCLQSIKDGILHLHSLGLIHNDINPHNVMMNEDDVPIIIDFDSCQPEGAKLAKLGTPDWAKEGMDISQPENDFYGLSKLEEFLSQEDHECSKANVV